MMLKRLHTACHSQSYRKCRNYQKIGNIGRDEIIGKFEISDVPEGQKYWTAGSVGKVGGQIGNTEISQILDNVLYLGFFELLITVR